MLKRILNFNNVKTLRKEQQANINGGMANSCFIGCRQDFADCLEDGYGNFDCFENLMICRSRC